MKQFLIFLCLFCATFATAQRFATNDPAVVYAVHDGDSYGVRFLSRPDTTIYIRLHNVDSPEIIFYVTKDQPYGRQAGSNMRSFLKGDTVLVTVVYNDVFGRLVCDVTKNGIDLTEYVISTGNGWYQPDSATTLEREAKLKSLQAEAKKKKKGLWGEKGSKVRPETWRKKYSRV